MNKISPNRSRLEVAHVCIFVARISYKLKVN